MARKTPRIETVKALLARSGNQCAFPDCNHPIINESNKLIAQLCHIEAANVGGERYNQDQNDEERRAYDNLIFLCYRHHIETNDETLFTVSKLKEIKEKHEKQFTESIFSIEDRSKLDEIYRSIEKYWEELRYAHEFKNIVPEDLRIRIDADSGNVEIFQSLREKIMHYRSIISHLHESTNVLEKDFKATLKSIDFLGILSLRARSLPYYRNPFINRDWEYWNIGIPNLTSQIDILLNQLEIKILETELINEPDNENLSNRLKLVKEEFLNQAQKSGFID